MLRLLSDENFHGDVVAGLRRHHPDLDLVRAQDVGLSGQPDPDVLAWAAQEGRNLLTRDKRTMIDFVRARVARGEATPAVFLLRPRTSVKDAIEAVAMVALLSDPSEWADEVYWLPL